MPPTPEQTYEIVPASITGNPATIIANLAEQAGRPMPPEWVRYWTDYCDQEVIRDWNRLRHLYPLTRNIQCRTLTKSTTS